MPDAPEAATTGVLLVLSVDINRSNPPLTDVMSENVDACIDE